jgi:hypothetical protein
MPFPTKAASGVMLSIIKKWVARTLIQKLQIALQLASGAGLDSTNMARARLVTEAQEKNYEAERSL